MLTESFKVTITLTLAPAQPFAPRPVIAQPRHQFGSQRLCPGNPANFKHPTLKRDCVSRTARSSLHDFRDRIACHPRILRYSLPVTCYIIQKEIGNCTVDLRNRSEQLLV